MANSDMPPIKAIAYDLEFARPVPNEDWSRMTECGISVITSWSSHEVEPRIWIVDEHPDVLRRFAAHAVEHDIFVTWNGMSCDDKMIEAQLPVWQQVLGCGRSVDVAILSGLYSIAEKKGHDLSGLTDKLSLRIPENYPALVGYKPSAQVNVKRGWSLDSTYSSTFNLPTSSKSMEGAEAPLRWAAGSRAEVIGYCVGDSLRTFRLWRHAWFGKPLRNAKGVTVRLPRCVLGGKEEGGL